MNQSNGASDQGQERPLPLPSLDLSTVPLDDVPARRWIVPGLIPDRNVTDLSGDGGLGKSLLALQLGIAMTAGREWIGVRPEQGRVLYVSCEDECDEIMRRRNAILAGEGLPATSIAGLHLLDLTEADTTELAAGGKSGALELTRLYERLAVTLEEMQPKLVILDTRADVYAASEIDRGMVRRFVQSLRRLCLRHDLAILLLSHPSVAGMASGSGQSGSTAWGNSVRSRLYLTAPKPDEGAQPDPDVRMLSSKKANYGPRGVEIVLKWDRGMFRPDASALREVKDQKVETRFLELMDEAERQNIRLNRSSGPNYAPKVFIEMDPSYGKRKYTTAMTSLLQKGLIENIADKRGSHLVLTAAGMSEIASPF